MSTITPAWAFLPLGAVVLLWLIYWLLCVVFGAKQPEWRPGGIENRSDHTHPIDVPRRHRCR